MKQYVIDELRPSDYDVLKAYLNDHFSAGPVDGIYWLPVEADMLTREQTAHTDCHPLYVAVDLASDRLSVELLLRTQTRMRCSCMGYATETQRNWLIRTIDAMFDRLDIKI